MTKYLDLTWIKDLRGLTSFRSYCKYQMTDDWQGVAKFSDELLLASKSNFHEAVEEVEEVTQIFDWTVYKSDEDWNLASKVFKPTQVGDLPDNLIYYGKYVKKCRDLIISDLNEGNLSCSTNYTTTIEIINKRFGDLK